MLPRNRPLIALLFSCLLAACSPSESAVPPEEVLRNAARASQTLESALFTADVKINGQLGQWQGDATADLEGRMQQAGGQLQFHADVEGGWGIEELYEMMLSADVVVGGPEEVYLRILELASDPPSPFFSMEGVEPYLNRWLLLPPSEPGGGDVVSPDPRLLRAQAEIVRVTEDKGLQSINGRDAFRYETTIDPEKLSAFIRQAAPAGEEPDLASLEGFFASHDVEGEMWIDAETFLIHRIDWTARPRLGQGISVTFSLTLRDHNAAPAVEIPADAVPFAPEGFILPPASGTGAVEGLDSEQEEQLRDALMPEEDTL